MRQSSQSKGTNVPGGASQPGSQRLSLIWQCFSGCQGAGSGTKRCDSELPPTHSSLRRLYCSGHQLVCLYTCHKVICCYKEKMVWKALWQGKASLDKEESLVLNLSSRCVTMSKPHKSFELQFFICKVRVIPKVPKINSKFDDLLERFVEIRKEIMAVALVWDSERSQIKVTKQKGAQGCPSLQRDKRRIPIAPSRWDQTNSTHFSRKRGVTSPTKHC